MNNKKVKPDYIKNIIKTILEKEFRKIYKDFKISKIILQTKEGKSGPFIKVFYDKDYEGQFHTIFLSDYIDQRDEQNLQQILCLCESIEDLKFVSDKTKFDIYLLEKELTNN